MIQQFCLPITSISESVQMDGQSERENLFQYLCVCSSDPLTCSISSVVTHDVSISSGEGQGHTLTCSLLLCSVGYSDRGYGECFTSMCWHRDAIRMRCCVIIPEWTSKFSMSAALGQQL